MTTLLTIENYRGNRIVFNSKKNRFEGKKGAKVIHHHTTVALLKNIIDSWENNVECSRQIDNVKLTSSPNPNVRHKGIH
jgi:hypothetical protein